ncbi:hypothetical protein GCM10007242_35390 [Pigmentiphaga litoralis]|uniref:hypothetical protein n=1 Tax=Pigmentiphaga litoralis TaxID=516702 RepID=UPI001678370C|nr:hypothetical protein [Pigmentiphaga litoralis]GGX24766.1 hypothetical protein GCM10007242_35390 [Pigmentiphaga litoralis]
MRALTPHDVLALWDEGAHRHPLDRSALLCARARSDLPADTIVDLPLGEVTRSVLRLREATFGGRIDSHVDCPFCGARLAVSVMTSEVLPGDAAAQVVDAAHGLRPPTLRDLAAVADVPDAEDGARRLLQRCMTASAPASLLDADLAEIEALFEALDPNADVGLQVICTECGKPVLATLDATVVLWDEIEAQGKALLRMVHVLAVAYGWTESETLALSPVRRAAYMAMVSP